MRTRGLRGRHRWPVTLAEGQIALTPLRRSDRREFDEVRRRNHGWLLPWEATAPPAGEGPLPSFGDVVRRLDVAARRNQALPWIVRYTPAAGRQELVGQLTVNNIVYGSARMCSMGYWLDERWAGRGIMPRSVALAGDYCFETLGLHRIEIAIRPENGKSLRVVQKLGFRAEGLRPAFLHINGAWRDHLIFAMHDDEVGAGLLARLGDTPRRLSGSERAAP